MTIHKKIKRQLKSLAGARVVSFYDMELYAPYSRGPNRQKTDHALDAVLKVFSLLSNLSTVVRGDFPEIRSAEEFGADTRQTALALKELLDQEGSDKANKHNYHFVLGRVLHERESITSVLEVGLGTNNPKVVSNMTAKGRPGALVRAFRDFLPNAQIFGADYDRGILFEEERIKTFFCDQTDPASLAVLAKQLPAGIDLIIDDGLHSPTANIATLTFALPLLKDGGWAIIEDINPETIPIWHVVARLLPDDYSSEIVMCAKCPIFVVRKRPS